MCWIDYGACPKAMTQSRVGTYCLIGASVGWESSQNEYSTCLESCMSSTTAELPYVMR